MTRPAIRLDRFDSAGFLRDSWQRRPLLIRDPWQAWSNPLDPEELAELATDEDVEARLIVQNAAAMQAETGPFAAARFDALSREPWTLLVQAVDHYVPAVAALLDPFRFIPNWRIDDVMVSHASTGGGVGPHFDQYDVFLVQGLGRRRWQIGGECDATTPLAPHDELRLLADFQPVEEWVLDPGDILYVPPRFAHNGVALDDRCMTYSIGFRAPSRRELIGDWCDHLLDDAPDDDRFRDGALQPSANPGEISAAAIAGLHAMVAEKILDRAAFARWFGQHHSTRKYPEIDWSPESPIPAARLRARLAAGVPLCRNAASRFSFIRPDADTLLLFVDGQAFACSGATIALAERLCAVDQLTIARELRTGPPLALLAALIDQGSLALVED